MAKATVSFYAKQMEPAVGGEAPVLREPPMLSSEVDTSGTAFSAAAPDGARFCRVCSDGPIYRRVGLNVTTATNVDPGMPAGVESFGITVGHRVAIAVKA